MHELGVREGIRLCVNVSVLDGGDTEATAHSYLRFKLTLANFISSYFVGIEILALCLLTVQ